MTVRLMQKTGAAVYMDQIRKERQQHNSHKYFFRIHSDEKQNAKKI